MSDAVQVHVSIDQIGPTESEGRGREHKDQAYGTASAKKERFHE